MQSPEEIEEAVGRLISTTPSPESAIHDPTRRRTEIYERKDQRLEHLKLRDDAGFDLRAIDKIQEQQQRTSDTKTEDKVNELIAANAATQATVTALAAENAGIKALLTQLVELQTRGESETLKAEPKLTSTDYSTETETDNRTDLPTETETETDTEHNTELKTEM